jgi:hypothetical protein
MAAPSLSKPMIGPPVTQTRPVLIASEGDITGGALKANDAYDLSLYRMPNGSFEVVLFMKLQFFFESGAGGDWTEAEEKKFVRDWRVAVQSAWSGRNIHVTASGKSVSIRLDFETQVGGWMFDHWEITVTKIKAGTFSTSYVNVGSGNVTLDSEDLNAVNKGGPQTQRGAVHEFGHMLGLDDEYPAASTHTGDKASVMNSSETVRQRHDSTIRTWVIQKLAAYGIK